MYVKESRPLPRLSAAGDGSFPAVFPAGPGALRLSEREVEAAEDQGARHGESVVDRVAVGGEVLALDEEVDAPVGGTETVEIGRAHV